MDLQYDILVNECVGLASQMSLEQVTAVAAILDSYESTGISEARQAVLAATPQPSFRNSLDGLLTQWQKNVPYVSPRELAGMLLSAARTASAGRKQQQIELIWTGPGSASVSMRRTDQALLQVINAAQDELLLMSYAVSMVPAVGNALVFASQRGVFTRICIETPQQGAASGYYDTLAALGTVVRTHATVYTWRHDNRPVGPNGKPGKMHVKCALADRDLVFISSANLTGHAMNLNMELGVLIRGGKVPSQVYEQFHRMLSSDQIVKVANS